MYTGLGTRPAESIGKRSRTGAWNGTVLALGATSFFSDISSEMVLAVLPLFLTVGLGLSPAVFGLFQGAWELANAALRIVGGVLADRSGRLKETAASGYALSTATRGGLVVSVWAGLAAPFVLPFLLIDRLGKGLRTGPRDAMISLATPAQSWGTAFGIHRTLDAAGALIGPLLAFLVLWAVPGSFDSIFVLSFCFGLLGVAVITTRVENPTAHNDALASSHPGGTNAASPDRRRLRLMVNDLRSNRGYRRIVGLGSAFGLFTVGDALLYLVVWESSAGRTGDRLGVTGFGMEWFPLLFAGTAISFLLVATPIGRLADRCGRGRVWVVGHLAIAAAYGLLLWRPGDTLTVVAMLALLGVYYGATDGVLPALASGVIPAESRSTGLAVLTTCVAFSRMLSAAGFGLMWSAFGADHALIVSLTGLLVVLTLGVRDALRQPLPAT